MVQTAYLDIETNYVGSYRGRRMFRDYINHRITVLGVRILDERDDRFSVTSQCLLEILADTRRIVTYNGRSLADPITGTVGFDFPVIQMNLGVALDRHLEHTDLALECWKHQLYGGLKCVEKTLGLRRNYVKGGAWAMRTWRRYIGTKNQMHLIELLAYNREDVFMLRELELRLAALHDRRLQPG